MFYESPEDIVVIGHQRRLFLDYYCHIGGTCIYAWIRLFPLINVGHLCAHYVKAPIFKGKKG